MDLNGDEEKRLIEQAMERAQAATQNANSKLGFSARSGERDAFNGALNDAGGPTSLADTASYSDYLEAKKGAAAAWAAVTGPSLSPRSIRDSLLGGAKDASKASGAGLGAREDAADASIGASRGAGVKGKAQQAAERAARAEAEKLRADSYEAGRIGALGGVMSRSTEAARNAGADVDFVGDYNPTASSGYAQDQAGFWANKAKGLGASDDEIISTGSPWLKKGSRSGRYLNRNVMSAAENYGSSGPARFQPPKPPSQR